MYEFLSFQNYEMEQMSNTNKQTKNSVRQQPQTLLAPGTGFIEDNFSTDLGLGWFGDDSGTLHLLCTLFLLLLHQLRLRSSGLDPGGWGPLL